MTGYETFLLREMLDRYPAAHVLNELADLSSHKAEEIRERGGSALAASKWEKASADIGQLAARLDL